MRIFLSYRRHDTAGHVGHLADDLAARFGPAAVFRDLDSIAPGRDFARAIDEAIAASHAVLVVIGREWLAVGADGRRRLDNEYDFVRAEIVAALARKLLVIPVLVEGASMPSEADLPAPIKALARHNATELSDSRWDYDVGRLIAALEPDLPQPVRATGPDSRPARRAGMRVPLVGFAVAAAVAAAVVAGGLSLSGGGGGGGGGSGGGGGGTVTTAGATADEIAGTWSGTGGDSTTGTVLITFVVLPGCRVGEVCGTAEAVAADVACYGDIKLYGMSGGTYEFDVTHLRTGSSPTCETGRGHRLITQGGSRVLYASDSGSTTLTRG